MKLKAQACYRRRQESITRNQGDIDSDNCVTTFCSDLSAREYERKADLGYPPEAVVR